MTSVLPSSTSLILVAVMPDRRDLDIARMLGWYRIPLRSAPKVVAVDYLAFYQTAAFEDEKWRIQWVAEVRGHELATRAELLQDEPNHPHARQEYYKIQLGPLQPLPRPILADNWRRVTFFYTTGEYLNRALTLHDLIVAEEQRPILWQALHERACQEGLYQAAEMPKMNLDPILLATLLGLHEPEALYRSG